MIVEYILLCGLANNAPTYVDENNKLGPKVTQKLAEGYKLYGKPVNQMTLTCQAMIKEKPNE